MGREIRRVPVGFDWPIDETWHGFLNPHYEHRCDCRFCGGCGLNPATKQIEDDWYDFDRTGARWDSRLTLHEVAALVEAGRLHDFTHTWSRETGWVEKDPPYLPTSAEVNEWSKRGMGHDAINRWICVEARAKRWGVHGPCEYCDGDGDEWRTPEDKQAAEDWERTEPPVGEGWQVWETVSEGSPISPVFATPEELVDYLAEGGDEWCRHSGNPPPSREAATKFVESGFAMSMIVANGKMKSGIDSCDMT